MVTGVCGCGTLLAERRVGRWSMPPCWARMEAGVHFPSDTLFSLALGNFIASFVNDAFLGAGPADTLELQPLSDGAMLTWQVAF